jgi:hypothetical protein
MFSSSLLQIEFDRKSAIYYGSELLTGIVHLTTNDLHLHKRQNSIELYGKVTYETVYHHDNKASLKIETITFLCQKSSPESIVCESREMFGL